jgi:hypothetical protein
VQCLLRHRSRTDQLRQRQPLRNAIPTSAFVKFAPLHHHSCDTKADDSKRKSHQLRFASHSELVIDPDPKDVRCKAVVNVIQLDPRKRSAGGHRAGADCV